VRKLLRKKSVKIKMFTPDDALRLSRQKGVDTSGLSRGSAKIVRESRFTSEQINRAFTEAKKMVHSSSKL
jgi:hypothetical protein